MKLRLAFPLTLALVGPVSALELDQLTDQERILFGQEVRSYLLENPQVLQEAISVLQERDRLEQLQRDAALAQANAEAIRNDGYSFVGGNPDGDVTIVEFLDYRCGFCKRAFPEVAALIERDPNVRLIVKEFPILGEQSVLASRFAIATQQVAGEAAYKDVHDTLMEFQGDISQQTLNRLGDVLGLDTPAIVAEMGSDTVNRIIAENRDLAQRLQISGTPTFIFEDQMIRGYVELAQMEALIDDLRATAQ